MTKIILILYIEARNPEFVPVELHLKLKVNTYLLNIKFRSQ